MSERKKEGERASERETKRESEREAERNVGPRHRVQCAKAQRLISSRLGTQNLSACHVFLLAASLSRRLSLSSSRSSQLLTSLSTALLAQPSQPT
eukprot:3419750-Rhodomonas_salina.3